MNLSLQKELVDVIARPLTFIIFGGLWLAEVISQ